MKYGSQWNRAQPGRDTMAFYRNMLLVRETATEHHVWWERDREEFVKNKVCFVSEFVVQE